MARRKVSVNPMQKTLGEDYIDDETIGKLAYLNPDQNINLSGAAQPQVSSNQKFQDVPRQVSVKEDVEEEFNPEDLQGLDLLGQIAQNEAYEDSLDAVSETEPPDQYQPREVFQLPTDDEGNLMNSLQFIKSVIEEEPELYDSIPEETKDRLSYIGYKTPTEEVVSEKESVSSPSSFVSNLFSDEIDITPYLPEETKRVINRPNTVEYQRLISEAENLSKPIQGGVEAGLNDPRINAILERVDDLQQGQGYPEDIKEKAALWEEYYNNEQSEMSSEAKKLAEKAKNNELTNSEIIALGLATIVPALLALAYGKEAALGAIGGGLQGAAKYMEGKEKSSTEAAKGLKDLEKRKIDLMDKDTKFREDFQKTITDPTVRKLVKERGYEVLPEYGTVGIKVIPELGVYLEGDINESDAKLFEKEFPEDRKAFAGQKEVDKSLSDIDDMMEVIRDIDPNYYNVFLSKVTGYDPTSLKEAWGRPIPKVDMMIDGKIRKVNPLQQLSAMIGKFQSVYAKQSGLGNRLTDNVKKHAEQIIPDPSNPGNWLASDATDLQNKIKTLRNVLNRGFVEDAAARNYVKGSLKAQYPYSDMQVYRPSENVNDALKRRMIVGEGISNIEVE